MFVALTIWNDVAPETIIADQGFARSMLGHSRGKMRGVLIDVRDMYVTDISSSTEGRTCSIVALAWSCDQNLEHLEL